MTKIDQNLLQFFTRYGYNKDALSSPWTHEGKVYASNGHIIIIVPETPNTKVSPNPVIFGEVAKTTMRTISGYPHAQTFESLPPLPVPLSFCDECKEWVYGMQDPIAIGEAYIQACYLFKLHVLPNCKISVPEDAEKAIHFIFDGGEGWVMPYKVMEVL